MYGAVMCRGDTIIRDVIAVARCLSCQIESAELCRRQTEPIRDGPCSGICVLYDKVNLAFKNLRKTINNAIFHRATTSAICAGPTLSAQTLSDECR